MSASKAKVQLTEEEIKERDLKKLTNNVSLLFKSANNITNYIVEKGDAELTSSEIKSIFEALRPTIKSILTTSKLKPANKGGKRSKVQRDPNMPKKPASPYFLFCGKMRPVVSKRDSSLHPQQVVTELGKLWKELPEDQKEKYRIEAEKQKAIYEEKMKEYNIKVKEDAEKAHVSDYSSSESSSGSSSEEDEVESEEDSSDDEKRSKKVTSKKMKSKAGNTVDRKKKRKLNADEGQSKKQKSMDDDKKKIKKTKKAAPKVIKKKAKPQIKQDYPDESSSGSSSSSGSDSE